MYIIPWLWGPWERLASTTLSQFMHTLRNSSLLKQTEVTVFRENSCYEDDGFSWSLDWGSNAEAVPLVTKTRRHGKDAEGHGHDLIACNCTPQIMLHWSNRSFLDLRTTDSRSEQWRIDLQIANAATDVGFRHTLVLMKASVTDLVHKLSILSWKNVSYSRVPVFVTWQQSNCE